MANNSTESQDSRFFGTVKHFPNVNNNQINIKEFLEAASDLVALVERLGKLFAPVRYDMQGNIDKIEKYYSFDEQTCLLDSMLNEINKGHGTATEGVLWLNRALLFFELIFQELHRCLERDNYDISMKNIYTVAYEGSVKKYHSWVTQQIFAVICKMSPGWKEIMKSLEIISITDFKANLSDYIVTLHAVRSKIDSFFADNNLFTNSM